LHDKSILTILFLSLWLVANIQPDVVNAITGLSSIGIRTDNVRYVVGTPVRVSGDLFDEKGNLYLNSTPVTISVQQTHETSFLGGEKALNTSSSDAKKSSVVVTAIQGSYSTLITPPPEAGIYNVSAKATAQVYDVPYVNTSTTSVSSSTSIEVQELFYTRPVIMLFVGGLVGYVGLGIITIKESHLFSERTYYLLRFVFLTIVAITPIIALSFTDVQIAPLSPIGIVTKIGNTTENTIDESFNNQWVINVGGLASDNYSEGIQIPINIIIFGISGGYLRFLYYTSSKGLQITEGERSIPFFETLKDLSIMLLSPLLAIAVWLVLFQGGTTSMFTLAAISFTIGLVTREVVYALIGFVASKISSKEFSSDKAKAPQQKRRTA
jgi:hypothetical protein